MRGLGSEDMVSPSRIHVVVLLISVKGLVRSYDTRILDIKHVIVVPTEQESDPCHVFHLWSSLSALTLISLQSYRLVVVSTSMKTEVWEVKLFDPGPEMCIKTK